MIRLFIRGLILGFGFIVAVLGAVFLTIIILRLQDRININKAIKKTREQKK